MKVFLLLLGARTLVVNLFFMSLQNVLLSSIFKLIPSSLEYKGYEVKDGLAKTFKKRDVILPIAFQLSITNEVGNM